MPEPLDSFDLLALEMAAKMLREIADDPDYVGLQEWRLTVKDAQFYRGRPPDTWGFETMFRTADRLDSLRFRLTDGERS